MNKVYTFLMFEGQAEAAINFYVSLIKDAKLISIDHYTAAGPGKEGTVAQAFFSIGDQVFRATDSPVHHNFAFTPAMSLFLEAETEEELDELFKQLSENGQVLMGLGNYGFSRKFGWVNDRFGVSWQINLK